jgi:hypothetical protein
MRVAIENIRVPSMGVSVAQATVKAQYVFRVYRY